jgi:hypothetical protein
MGVCTEEPGVQFKVEYCNSGIAGTIRQFLPEQPVIGGDVYPKPFLRYPFFTPRLALKLPVEGHVYSKFSD